MMVYVLAKTNYNLQVLEASYIGLACIIDHSFCWLAMQAVSIYYPLSVLKSNIKLHVGLVSQMFAIFYQVMIPDLISINRSTKNQLLNLSL